MKIVIFQMKGPTSNEATGGAEKYSEELAFVLEGMGCDVEIYCGRDKDEKDLPAFEQRTDRIIVRRFNSPLNFLPLSLIPMHWHYFRKERKNSDYIIENQSVIPMLTPIYHKNLFTIIHHLTGKDYIRKQGKIKGSVGIFLETKMLPFMYKKQNILTVSEHSKESVVAVGFDSKQISIIPPIVRSLDENYSYSAKRKNIISYVGRYTGRSGNKRIDAVIEVMPEVLKVVADAKLIIGGSMKKKDELLTLIEKYGLQEVVEFRGFLTDNQKAQLLSESKIFASPSYQEGFGITYIEAHSFGTPVVGYEIAGLDTVPENSGIMVAKDDKKALAQAIIDLLTDDDEWQRKSSGALANADYYSAKKIQAEYKKYIESKINEKMNA